MTLSTQKLKLDEQKRFSSSIKIQAIFQQHTIKLLLSFLTLANAFRLYNFQLWFVSNFFIC